MTKELLFTLTTGDMVKNTKTGAVRMVVAIANTGAYCIAIEEMVPLEDWELQKSRLVVTPEELRRIEEYHRKIKEQEESRRK